MHIVLDVSGRVWPCMDNSSQQCKGVFGSETAWNGMEWFHFRGMEWLNFCSVGINGEQKRSRLN
jgi:hypothetical protein